MSRTGDAIIQAMEEGLWEPAESWDPDPCEGCERAIEPGTIRCPQCTVHCDQCGSEMTRGALYGEWQLCPDCRPEEHDCGRCLACVGMRESDF